MKHYLKIQDNKIKEAPFEYKGKNYTIYGYNVEGNQPRLLQDGYTAFPLPKSAYQIKQGAIVEKEKQPQPQICIFSKLCIRRACRQLGIEDKLDMIINSNDEFKKDWQDSNEINLLDPVFVQAIQQNGYITQQEINEIKHIIEATR